jgi:hyaluronan synthase
LLEKHFSTWRFAIALALQQRKTEKVTEMDKKRWMIRYLMIAGIGAVLAIKIYLLLFVVDLTVGIYSFFTSFILFNIFFISFTRYKDPYLDAKDIVLSNDNKPLVSMVVPVKNEEGNIRNCVQSCINSTYSNKEIIIVNDGSNDSTPQILDEMKKEEPLLRIIHLSKSVGKKQAIEAACEVAKGDIFLFMDSDCDIARLLKGMETTYSSLTCCSGSLSIFRRAAVKPYIHAWAHDKFLGIEDFKFATDRRLTAYVLGEKPFPVLPNDDKNQHVSHSGGEGSNNNFNIPILLQTGKDGLHTMKSSSDPDIDSPKKNPRYAWRLVYSPSVRASAGVPETFTALLKQQIRWRKSFIRSIFATGGIYWRRPLWPAVLYYLQISLKLLRPIIIMKALIFLPLSGDFATTALYIIGALYSGMLYGIDVRLRSPGYKFWIYRPIMTFISTFIFSWLVIYAAITIRKTGWR